MIVMATELQWIISTLVHLVGTGFDGNPGCEKKEVTVPRNLVTALTPPSLAIWHNQTDRNQDHVCKSKLFGF